MNVKRRFLGTLKLLLAMLAASTVCRHAHAYIGPGAGFVFISSFLAVFVVAVLAVLSILLWPFRLVWRTATGRRAYRRSKKKKILVLGLDGLDPVLLSKFMAEGKLPNFARLAEVGVFSPLRTTLPPISPVAWSSFLTGVSPARHNVFDFLRRDPRTYLPNLSSASVEGATRRLDVAGYSFPIGRPRIKLLRKSQPFWHLLGEQGIFSTIIRVPVTFPPERCFGLVLSGLCVPDIKGGQGTFSFYTTADQAAQTTGGIRIPLKPQKGGFSASIPGLLNPIRPSDGEMSTPFEVHPSADGSCAEIRIGRDRYRVRVGQYTPWVRVCFRAGPAVSIRGICRFYLKGLDPNLELYVSPVQIDPASPALPISHPVAYSVYLAKTLGSFATLGLAEDTWALNEGVLDEEAFLQQCYTHHAEREKMLLDAVHKTDRGFIACVFDTPDRIQHMFWRYMDARHTAPRRTGSPGLQNAIADMYRMVDSLVGRISGALGSEGGLIVMSDHGFRSFRRGVGINSWLRENGYLSSDDGSDWLTGVDWSKTRAYALGLAGIYLNQEGREAKGTVAPGAETEALRKEIAVRLLELRDPLTGDTPISAVFDTRRSYDGPYRENAPDLVVGYNEGYRASWESVRGKLEGTVISDNARAWSGDHCIDPRLVPGVILSDMKLNVEGAGIMDVAPTVLELFGLPIPPYMEGRSLACGR